MNKRIKLLGVVVLVSLLLTAVMATSALAQGSGPYGRQGRPGWGGMMGRGLTGGYGQGYGPGMMGGWRSTYPGTAVTNTQPYNGYGYGMMGPGMMAGMMGRGMMGWWGAPANANPISIDQAAAAAQQYVAAYNNSDLALSEIMEFTGNFYVQVKERSTGKGAFELLVDRYNGAVFPEMGPNMMWNTRYSPMGSSPIAGVGGWWSGQQAGPMTVTEQQARSSAQQFLDANFPGAALADDTATFYGHYTIDFLQNGKLIGMLSVNGYTGQVWYHNWHGTFIAEKEL